METNTNNYNLKKPSPQDFYNVQDQNGNMDVIDAELKKLNDNKAEVEHNHNGIYETPSGSQSKVDAAMESSNQYTDQKISNINTSLSSHLSDYVRQPGYGATAGSANTYTFALNPAPTSYVDGMGIVVKINAANTGASTINVNGLGAKAIVDGKGNALTSGKLRLNGTYSLKYNSTSGNFILQGEGGEIPKLPNLVRNGSFVNGLNMWPYYSAGTPVIANNEVVFTATAQYGSVYQSNIPYVAGHKYYISAYVYGDSNAQIFATDNINFSYPVVHSPTVQYERLSGIFTPSAVAGLVQSQLGIRSSKTSAWTQIKAGKFLLIDLTDAFGAGNEPTQAEVDAMVTKYSSWWDSNLSMLTNDATLPDGSWLLTPMAAYGLNGQIIQGAMPDRRFAANNNNPTGVIGVKADQVGSLYVQPQYGFYTAETNAGGYGTAVAYDANFIASNIVSGKSIFGLAGSFVPTIATSGGNALQLYYKSAFQTTSSTYVKVLELTTSIGGSFRFVYDWYGGYANSYIGKMQIYKNGVPIGVERISNTGAQAGYVEDIGTFAPGDKIQFYMSCEGGRYSTIINLFIYSNSNIIY